MGQLAARAALHALYLVGIFYAVDKMSQHLNERSREAANKK